MGARRTGRWGGGGAGAVQGAVPAAVALLLTLGATVPAGADGQPGPPDRPGPAAAPPQPDPADAPAPDALAAEIAALVAGIGPRTPPEERERIRRILEGLPAAAIPLLRETAGRSREPEAAALLRAAAAAIEARRQVEREHPGIASADAEERVSTLRGLAARAEPRLTAVLLRALDTDPAPEVRLEALRALGRVREERAAPVVVEGLRAEDPVWCGEASGIVTEWAGAADRRELLRALCRAWERSASPRPVVFLDALITVRRPDLGEFYAALLRAAEPEVRAAAAAGLARQAAREHVAAVAARLGDPDPLPRAAAAAALGDLGGRAELPALIVALADPDAGVVRAAHAALQKLTGQHFAPDADLWNRWLADAAAPRE